MISVVSLIIKEDFNERYTRNLPYRQSFFKSFTWKLDILYDRMMSKADVQ